MPNDRHSNFKELSNYHVHSDTEIMSQKEQNWSDVLLVKERDIGKYNSLKEGEDHEISDNKINMLNFNNWTII